MSPLGARRHRLSFFFEASKMSREMHFLVGEGVDFLTDWRVSGVGRSNTHRRL
jgi:hypothetical protein